MWIWLKSSISYLFNCVLFVLISGQINEVILQTSGLNLTANKSVIKSSNTSLILDILNKNPNQISLETIANYSVNICDDIDCNNNREICEQNRCSPKKRMTRTHHYIVTCAIVLVIIGLILTTIYACRKESHRMNRWNNSCNNRFEDNMIAISFVQSLRYNRRFPDISPIHEMVPLSIANESPPPYDQNQYTPPPDYDEALRFSNEFQKIDN